MGLSIVRERRKIQFSPGKHLAELFLIWHLKRTIYAAQSYKKVLLLQEDFFIVLEHKMHPNNIVLVVHAIKILCPNFKL